MDILELKNTITKINRVQTQKHNRETLERISEFENRVIEVIKFE